eukprot:UN08215
MAQQQQQHQHQYQQLQQQEQHQVQQQQQSTISDGDPIAGALSIGQHSECIFTFNRIAAPVYFLGCLWHMPSTDISQTIRYPLPKCIVSTSDPLQQQPQIHPHNDGGYGFRLLGNTTAYYGLLFSVHHSNVNNDIQNDSSFEVICYPRIEIDRYSSPKATPIAFQFPNGDFRGTNPTPRMSTNGILTLPSQ